MYCTSYWKKWISIATNVSLQEFTALLGGKWLTLLPNTYNRITNQHDEMQICVSKFISGPQRTKKTGSQLPLSGICGKSNGSPQFWPTNIHIYHFLIHKPKETTLKPGSFPTHPHCSPACWSMAFCKSCAVWIRDLSKSQVYNLSIFDEGLHHEFSKHESFLDFNPIRNEIFVFSSMSTLHLDVPGSW